MNEAEKKQLLRGKKFEAIFDELVTITGAIEWDMVDLQEIRRRHFADEEICGFCTEYDSDHCYCPHFGEMMEGDTCDHWIGEPE